MLVQPLDLVCQNIAVAGTPYKKSCISPDRRRLTRHICHSNQQMESILRRLLLIMVYSQSFEVNAPGEQALGVDRSRGSSRR
jgi:hypothetical protein